MENLKLKDFLDYNYLSGMEISPDEKNIGFVVHKADYDENKYNSNIWIMNKESKKYFRLTGMDEERSFIWLNNSDILFSGMRDKKLKAKIDEGEKWSCFYSIDINGGEAQEYMRIPLKVTSIKSIDEENFILTAQYDNYGVNLNELTGEERAEALQKIKEDRDYEIIDEIPFWSNGGGFTNKKRNRLYLYNKTSKKLQAISDEISNITYSSYKDGKILYVVNRFLNKQEQREAIYLYDISKETTELLLPSDEYRVTFAEFFGDAILCALNDTKKYGLNQNPDFYILKDGDLKLFKENDTWLVNTVGSDCRYGSGKNYRVIGEKLYYITTILHDAVLKSLDVNGKEEILTKLNGSVDTYVLSGDEIFFIGLRGLRLQEIYHLSGGEEKQLTKFNEEIVKNKKLSYPEKFNIKNDGVEIEGWVLKPTDYEEGKNYPAILDIHGGPKTVYGEVFYHEMQVWANMGYFVFFCNPRGGDGRGNEFADIRGKYGTIDYEDLMKFTDEVIKSYPILKDKVGVTGGSYGGFMTNWIIGHTDRFACAASQRSIANWFSKFGTTDIGYYFNVDQNASSPWDNPEKLWWHSPMKYADKVVTPTLFIHSEEDYRCWLVEGIQMFTSLKYHGVPARLCMFRGENHELSRSGKPKHRVKRLTEITNWFEQFLK